MIRALLLVLCLMTLALPSWAEPIPAWVEQAPLPEPPDAPEDFTEGGVFHLLHDRQSRIGPDGHETHTRRVIKVASRTGLEQAGALRFDYDPATETLAIHDIWRIRNGVRTRLETLDFVDIRRETEMEYGILDGRMTRYADVPDLRVGDSLDIASTRTGTPSVFTDHFSDRASLRPFAPYQVSNVRVLSADGYEIVVNGPAIPQVTRTDGWTDRSWQIRNVKRTYPDHYWQEFDAFYGLTQITSATSWAEIVNTIAPSYAPQPLPADVRTVVQGFDGPTSARVTAALRFVQDEIRYMGIQIGDGGYIPRAPELVWSRRFGDCKDKALLLVSMLAEMGISSDVVLVHSTNGKALDRRVPSPFVFDHAIVRVTGDGAPYFLDPTDLLQGGVGRDITVRDFAWALPLFPGSNALVPVPEQRAPAPTYDVLTRYDFDPDSDWAAELFVTTTYRGLDADYQRYSFDGHGTEDQQTSSFDWYADRYPGAETLTEWHFDDDLDANVLTVHEHYGLTDAGLADRRKRFWMNPYAVARELENLPEDGFDTPFPLDPLYHRHRVELVGHADLKPPTDYVMDNAFFRYSRTAYDVPGGVGGDFVIEVLAKEVTPDQAEAYTALVEENDQHDDWRNQLTRAGEVLAKPVLMGLRLDVWLVVGALLTALAVSGFAAFRGYRAEAADLRG